MQYSNIVMYHEIALDRKMHNQAHLMHTPLCLAHKVISENTQYTIPLSLYIEVKNDSYYGKLTKLFQ